MSKIDGFVIGSFNTRHYVKGSGREKEKPLHRFFLCIVKRENSYLIVKRIWTSRFDKKMDRRRGFKGKKKEKGPGVILLDQWEI